MKSLAQQYADAVIEAGPGAASRLVALLREHGLLPILPAVVRALEERERQQADRYVVSSPRPLSPSARKELERFVPKDAELTEKINPSLIGGVRVRLGDDLYDVSVQGSLERLRARMKQ